eukprot:GHRR01007610.1.p1 GENE.GHRR01007610.1~~GHRR01007610.1.p1  ORF type:complete len:600 (+),score=274.48 GHRR01007610.1:1821-3620(+)
MAIAACTCMGSSKHSVKWEVPAFHDQVISLARSTAAEYACINSPLLIQAAGTQASAGAETAAVLDHNRCMLLDLLQQEHQQQTEKQQQQLGQLLPITRQPQSHAAAGQQQPGIPAGPAWHKPSMMQLLSFQQQQPFSQATGGRRQQQQAQTQSKQAQQRRMSALYSTPQPQQANKKKPKFSIKETPPANASRTPHGLGLGSAAAAGLAAVQEPVIKSGTAAVAALLGPTASSYKPPPATAEGAATAAPADHGVVGDSSSKTPGANRAQSMATLYTTPRFSTTKHGSRLAQQSPGMPALPQTSPAIGTVGAMRTPCQQQQGPSWGKRTGASAAGDAGNYTEPLTLAVLFEHERDRDNDMANAGIAAGAGTEVAAGLEQGQEAAIDAAAAARGAQPSPLPSSTSSRRRSGTNPLLLMTEQRKRQQQFLQALPPIARNLGYIGGAGAGLAHWGGNGVPVPVSMSLAKVMQQVAAMQKQQQEQLGDMLVARQEGQQRAAGLPRGLLELEIVGKAFEAHLIKCLCIILQHQPQHEGPTDPQQGQQQQQPDAFVGKHMYLFVASKLGHAVDLSPGHKVRVHAPWYEVPQQSADAPYIVLAHLISE